jgi:hypothetical protein
VQRKPKRKTQTKNQKLKSMARNLTKVHLEAEFLLALVVLDLAERSVLAGDFPLKPRKLLPHWLTR